MAESGAGRPWERGRNGSGVEMASLGIALLAMAMSGVATFEQCFHRTSRLDAFVQGVSLDASKDPPELQVSMLLSNASERRA